LVMVFGAASLHDAPIGHDQRVAGDAAVGNGEADYLCQ